MTDDTTQAGEPVEPMSHERLAAIHGRLALISAWPWRTDAGNVTAADGEELVDYCYNRIDAEFIAHAPEDVDALLAEVDRLREIVDHQRELISDLSDRLEMAEAE